MTCCKSTVFSPPQCGSVVLQDNYQPLPSLSVVALRQPFADLMHYRVALCIARLLFFFSHSLFLGK